MTPEDVKREKERILKKANHYGYEFIGNSDVPEWEQRVSKWVFNVYHDKGSYKETEPNWAKHVKDYVYPKIEASFFFEIKANGEVEVGYSTTNRAVIHKMRFKNIKSLEEIDALFRFTSPNYK